MDLVSKQLTNSKWGTTATHSPHICITEKASQVAFTGLKVSSFKHYLYLPPVDTASGLYWAVNLPCRPQDLEEAYLKSRPPTVPLPKLSTGLDLSAFHAGKRKVSRWKSSKCVFPNHLVTRLF